MKWLFILLCFTARAQTNSLPVPPLYTVPQVIVITNNPFIVGTNVYRYLNPPVPHTNMIHLSWIPNTQVFTGIQWSTDNINWHEKVHLPIWQTNVDFLETNNCEFFRMYTGFQP